MVAPAAFEVEAPESAVARVLSKTAPSKKFFLICRDIKTPSDRSNAHFGPALCQALALETKATEGVRSIPEIRNLLLGVAVPETVAAARRAGVALISVAVPDTCRFIPSAKR